MSERTAEVADMINQLGSLIVRAHVQGEKDFEENLSWADCPFDFSAQILRDAWLIGYSEQENQNHLLATG